MDKHKISIIGSGPAGYSAAIRAAQMGMEVVVFEKGGLGGVCLNWGCIPTKTLATSASLLSNIKRADEFGINIKEYNLDFAKVQKRKESIVAGLSSGIGMLFNSHKIRLIKESAKIEEHNCISVNSEKVKTDSILIATGSMPLSISNIEFDHDKILSSKDMLSLKKIPRHLIIIGGGAIGCEFASIFKMFGSEVTIIEMAAQLLPNEDTEIAKRIELIFKKRGIKVFTNNKVEGIDKTEDGVKVFLSDGQVIAGDRSLVSIGRKPNTNDLGIEELGVVCDKGWIKTDKKFSTNIRNIYAAGDVTGGMLLAHVGSREGVAAIDAIAGVKNDINYEVIPSCIFTQPEIASVGLNDKNAKDKSYNTISRKFLFSAIGKSHIAGDTEGFLKLIVNSDNDKILGAHIIGMNATELIAELSVCIQYGITSEQLTRVIHAHPTLSEIVRETAEMVRYKTA